MACYRISEHLTDTDDYICHYPNEMKQMTGAIANELLCDGTNSIVMAWNSHPDCYDDVLWRVCKCMKPYIEIAEKTKVDAMKLFEQEMEK